MNFRILIISVAHLALLSGCGWVSLETSGPRLGNGAGYGGGDPLLLTLAAAQANLRTAVANLATSEFVQCRLPEGAEPGGSLERSLWEQLQELDADEDAFCGDFIRGTTAKVLVLLTRPVEDLFVLLDQSTLTDSSGTEVRARTLLSESGPVEILRSAVEGLGESSLIALLAHELFHKVVATGTEMPGVHVHDDHSYGPFATGRRLLDTVGARVSLEVKYGQGGSNCSTPRVWSEEVKLCLSPNAPAVMLAASGRMVFAEEFSIISEKPSDLQGEDYSVTVDSDGGLVRWVPSSEGVIKSECSFSLQHPDGSAITADKIRWSSFFPAGMRYSDPAFTVVLEDSTVLQWLGIADCDTFRSPHRSFQFLSPDSQAVDLAEMESFHRDGSIFSAVLSGKTGYYEWNLAETYLHWYITFEEKTLTARLHQSPPPLDENGEVLRSTRIAHTTRNFEIDPVTLETKNSFTALGTDGMLYFFPLTSKDHPSGQTTRRVRLVKNVGEYLDPDNFVAVARKEHSYAAITAEGDLSVWFTAAFTQETEVAPTKTDRRLDSQGNILTGIQEIAFAPDSAQAVGAKELLVTTFIPHSGSSGGEGTRSWYTYEMWDVMPSNSGDGTTQPPLQCYPELPATASLTLHNRYGTAGDGGEWNVPLWPHPFNYPDFYGRNMILGRGVTQVIVKLRLDSFPTNPSSSMLARIQVQVPDGQYTTFTREVSAFDFAAVGDSREFVINVPDVGMGYKVELTTYGVGELTHQSTEFCGAEHTLFSW